VKRYFAFCVLILFLFIVGCQEESTDSHQIDTYNEDNLTDTFGKAFQGQGNKWVVIDDIKGGKTSEGGMKTKHDVVIQPIGANPRSDVILKSLKINDKAYPLSNPVTLEMNKGQLEASVILKHDESVILSGDNGVELIVSTNSKEEVIKLSPIK